MQKRSYAHVVFRALGKYVRNRVPRHCAQAYQVLRKGGIKEDRIITLMYNDVANNAANPHPGKLFNKPGGGDVYDGVVVVRVLAVGFADARNDPRREGVFS